MIIPVTKPFLPPIEEYNQYIRDIWSRNWLTNNGPLVNELELKLKEYLNLDYLLAISNGTTALQIAYRALELEGEVITTPFSYVATTTSLIWENCTPVFVDIEADSFNINADLIEEAINENTTAIVATHVFGNPCDIDKIDMIAKKHNLRVIYDAAHGYGVTFKGKSLLRYGDISCISFHSTKLFHTVEGGGVVTNSPELLKKMSYLRNFGHDGPYQFNGIGINGKMSEYHAAMGLCNLNYVDEILEKRKKDYNIYLEWFKNDGFQTQKIVENCIYNYAYFPLVFKNEKLLLKALNELEINKVSPRRYFYPSLSKLSYSKQKMSVAEDIASRILCLPLYFNLSKPEIDTVSRLILRSIRY